MDLLRPFLSISDLQLPFEAEHALRFCVYVKKHFRIPDENVFNVGDEADQLHGGMYPKDPDGLHTPSSEIKATRDKIREWASYFPLMNLAISNHGMRWIKKASAAEIPSQMLRAYQDVLEVPEGWKWQYTWRIPTKHPFDVFHGMECSGKTPYRSLAELSAVSKVFGHLHSSAGLCHVNTLDKNVWAMNVGCLIDLEAYAFKYDKLHKFKPNRGVGVIFNRGSAPFWLPYES